MGLAVELGCSKNAASWNAPTIEPDFCKNVQIPLSINISSVINIARYNFPSMNQNEKLTSDHPAQTAAFLGLVITVRLSNLQCIIDRSNVRN